MHPIEQERKRIKGIEQRYNKSINILTEVSIDGDIGILNRHHCKTKASTLKQNLAFLIDRFYNKDSHEK